MPVACYSQAEYVAAKKIVAQLRHIRDRQIAFEMQKTART
jgi:hypothetical protein